MRFGHPPLDRAQFRVSRMDSNHTVNDRAASVSVMTIDRQRVLRIEKLNRWPTLWSSQHPKTNVFTVLSRTSLASSQVWPDRPRRNNRSLRQSLKFSANSSSTPEEFLDVQSVASTKFGVRDVHRCIDTENVSYGHWKVLTKSSRKATSNKKFY